MSARELDPAAVRAAAEIMAEVVNPRIHWEGAEVRSIYIDRMVPLAERALRAYFQAAS